MDPNVCIGAWKIQGSDIFIVDEMRRMLFMDHGCLEEILRMITTSYKSMTRENRRKRDFFITLPKTVGELVHDVNTFITAKHLSKRYPRGNYMTLDDKVTAEGTRLTQARYKRLENLSCAFLFAARIVRRARVDRTARAAREAIQEAIQETTQTGGDHE